MAIVFESITTSIFKSPLKSSLLSLLTWLFEILLILVDGAIIEPSYLPAWIIRFNLALIPLGFLAALALIASIMWLSAVLLAGLIAISGSPSTSPKIDGLSAQPPLAYLLPPDGPQPPRVRSLLQVVSLNIARSWSNGFQISWCPGIA